MDEMIPGAGVKVRQDIFDAGDEALVSQTVEGDERAFAELVRRHSPLAHSVAKSIVGSPDVADDVCQEALIVALRKIEQCRQPSRFRNWLLTIVRNRALNLVMAESRKGTVSFEVAGECPGSEDPHADLERKELRFKLHAMARTLSATQERVFRLHDVEGWTYLEIAEELGVSYSACRVHLHMARKRLRARLGEPGSETGFVEVVRDAS